MSATLLEPLAIRCKSPTGDDLDYAPTLTISVATRLGPNGQPGPRNLTR